MNDLVGDLGYALRTLQQNRLGSALIILTLGLGIGANTAIFSVLRGVLLKPLPYADSDRLVLIRQSAPGAGNSNTGVSIKEYFTYRDRAKSFSSIVEYHQMSFDLLKRGDPDRVNTGVVSHNFFDALGIQPILGRSFNEADDQPGAPAVLLLSYSYWQLRFSGDPNVVGQVFEMNDRPHTVIGVLPNVPLYPQENDVYMPVLACPFRAAAERNIAQNPRTFSILNVFGKLSPGVSRESASVEVQALAHHFASEDAQAYRPASEFTADALDVRDELTINARPMLWILMGTTGVILLLATANIANLTLAQLLNRERELALRAALGAARMRVLRQLLTESILIAVMGAAVGVGFAAGTLGLLTRFIAQFTSRTQDISLDPIVLIFTLIIAVLAGVGFGTIPASAAKVDLMTILKQSKGTSAGGRTGMLKKSLVVAQVAMAATLLAMAGLLLVSFNRLNHVDAGYRADHVLSAEIFGNFTKYPDTKSLLRFYLPVLDRLSGQPGVRSVALTNAVPLSTIRPGSNPFQIEDVPVDNPDRRPTADIRIVSRQYFATLGIPLITGRFFEESDDPSALPVVIINRTMAKLWEGRDPVGTRVSGDGGRTWATVVGVVGDARLFELDEAAIAQAYIPLQQMQGGVAGRLLVRTAGDPAAIASSVRDAVRTYDPEMPIENVRTLEELRNDSLARPRLMAILLSIFAGLALIVTLAGITGVIATSVTQRTPEFGIRMALGARRGQVLRLVLKEGLTLIAGGLTIGIAGALIAGRVLSSLLYRTQTSDPVALMAVAGTLVICGVAACLIPAWRASLPIRYPLSALSREFGGNCRPGARHFFATFERINIPGWFMSLPMRRRGAQLALLLVDLATFHDEPDALQKGDIFDGIAGNRHYVRLEVRRNRADRVTEVQRFGRKRRCADDGVHRFLSGFDTCDNLARVLTVCAGDGVRTHRHAQSRRKRLTEHGRHERQRLFHGPEPFGVEITAAHELVFVFDVVLQDQADVGIKVDVRFLHRRNGGIVGEQAVLDFRATRFDGRDDRLRVMRMHERS
jgi:putative ABC transport system permease protein